MDRQYFGLSVLPTSTGHFSFGYIRSQSIISSNKSLNLLLGKRSPFVVWSFECVVHLLSVVSNPARRCRVALFVVLFFRVDYCHY